MKNSKVFEKKSLFIVAICLISFMVIGSFMDFQISSALFHPESLFGIILAGYGQLPAMLCMSIARMIKIIKDVDYQDLKKFVVLLLGTMFLNMLIINIIKVPWGRPRMRMLAVTPEASFQPWRVIGNQAKDHLMALDVVGEEFKSFPSGHSGNATCAMLLGVLPLLNSHLKGKENKNHGLFHDLLF